jgi:fused signal recognition particle receptor
MSEGLFARLKSGLARSSRSLTDGISGVLTKRKLDQATLDGLEELLIAADLGTQLAAQVTERLRQTRLDKESTGAEVRAVLAEEIARSLTSVEQPFVLGAARPFVVLVVGVNGGGKTTTIGKLAKRLRGEGNSVVGGPGDTKRGAAGGGI